MHILIISTTERTGGAAIAASRLCTALNNHGAHAMMLVRDKQTDSMSVARVNVGKWAFIWERIRIWVANGFRMRGLWQTDLACAGGDITGTPEFQQADVIHLHWINQGFLSMDELKHILHSGKRVVWTLHDQWPVTGVCHYSATCEGYLTGCTKCPQLAGGLARRIFERKRRIYSSSHITFVGCSQWIARLAAQSPLTTGHRVTSIANALPQGVFAPTNQQSARLEHGLPLDVSLVLFSAFKVTDERKGFRFLAEALRKLHDTPVAMALVVVGRQAEAVIKQLSTSDFPFTIYPVSYVSDEHRMASLYAAADVFVSPSLQDNLPNTIAEAMSVGTPCVGFDVGGVPEMIDHEVNGYVARYCDADDLAAGIEYCLTNDLRSEAAAKAAHMFNEGRVARQYMEIYES